MPNDDSRHRRLVMKPGSNASRRSRGENFRELCDVSSSPRATEKAVVDVTRPVASNPRTSTSDTSSSRDFIDDSNLRDSSNDVTSGIIHDDECPSTNKMHGSCGFDLIDDFQQRPRRRRHYSASSESKLLTSRGIRNERFIRPQQRRRHHLMSLGYLLGVTVATFMAAVSSRLVASEFHFSSGE
jgi:hypothetical protein